MLDIGHNFFDINSKNKNFGGTEERGPSVISKTIIFTFTLKTCKKFQLTCMQSPQGEKLVYMKINCFFCYIISIFIGQEEIYKENNVGIFEISFLKWIEHFLLGQVSRKLNQFRIQFKFQPTSKKVLRPRIVGLFVNWSTCCISVC